MGIIAAFILHIQQNWPVFFSVFFENGKYFLLNLVKKANIFHHFYKRLQIFLIFLSKSCKQFPNFSVKNGKHYTKTDKNKSILCKNAVRISVYWEKIFSIVSKDKEEQFQRCWRIPGKNFSVVGENEKNWSVSSEKMWKEYEYIPLQR